MHRAGFFHEHLTGELVPIAAEPEECPFCGHGAGVGGILTTIDEAGFQLHQAICDTCGATGPVAATPAKAAAAWNRRTREQLLL